jgi:hypothetical protein
MPLLIRSRSWARLFVWSEVIGSSILTAGE